jgi:hypothetical protein
MPVMTRSFMSAAFRFCRRGLAVALLGLLATVCLVKLARTLPSASQFSSVRVNTCRLPSDDHAPRTDADVAAAAELQRSGRRIRRRDVFRRLLLNDSVAPISILQSPPNYDGDGISSVRSNAKVSVGIDNRRGHPHADNAEHPGRRLLPLPADHVPATLYFVWCDTQRRTFRFPHYLSVRAAVRAVSADAVWFYFAMPPTGDRWSYETWFGELEAEFPFFRRRSLFDLGHLDACVGNRPADDFVAWLVSTRGGIYVDVETAIADFRPSLRSLDVLAYLHPCPQSGGCGC